MHFDARMRAHNAWAHYCRGRANLGGSTHIPTLPGEYKRSRRLACHLNHERLRPASGKSSGHDADTFEVDFSGCGCGRFCQHTKKAHACCAADIFGAHYPAMALVQVVRLVEQAARVEIEATVVVPR
jgi:hypothetical protein